MAKIMGGLMMSNVELIYSDLKAQGEVGELSRFEIDFIKSYEKDEADDDRYKSLMSQSLVRPIKLEERIFIMHYEERNNPKASDADQMHQNRMDDKYKALRDLSKTGERSLSLEEKAQIAFHEDLARNKGYPFFGGKSIPKFIEDADIDKGNDDGTITMKLIPPRPGSESVYLHGKYSIDMLRRLVNVFDDVTTEQETKR